MKAKPRMTNIDIDADALRILKQTEETIKHKFPDMKRNYSTAIRFLANKEA